MSVSADGSVSAGVVAGSNMKDFAHFRIILAVDISTSMNDPVDINSMRSEKRFIQAKRIAEHLMDVLSANGNTQGMDLILFGSDVTGHKVANMTELRNYWSRIRVGGCTCTHLAIDKIADLHFNYKQHDPEHYDNGDVSTIAVILTDGIPDIGNGHSDCREYSKQLLEDSIRRLGRRCENGMEIGLSFVQIGNVPSATEFLNHLDDFDTDKDIVDTKPASLLLDGSLTISQLLCHALTD